MFNEWDEILMEVWQPEWTSGEEKSCPEMADGISKSMPVLLLTPLDIAGKVCLIVDPDLALVMTMGLSRIS